MARNAVKIDANQQEIIDALRAVGADVISLAKLGRGVPDLLIGFGGINYLMEIKNPQTKYGKKGLNPRQQKFQREWHNVVLVATSADEALKAIGAIR